jgi:hypothetical protein
MATGASLAFMIASLPVLLADVGTPWANILTLVPSLVLAPALLTLLVCLHRTVSVEKQIWSNLSVAFGTVYVALVSIVYIVQLAVLEPLVVRGEEERLVELLSIEPGGVLNAIDGLGYAFLCAALFVLVPAFQHGGRDKVIRLLLIANGAAVVPILLTYFVDRIFLLVTGPVWGVAIPAVSALLAVRFRAQH